MSVRLAIYYFIDKMINECVFEPKTINISDIYKGTIPEVYRGIKVVFQSEMKDEIVYLETC